MEVLQKDAKIHMFDIKEFLELEGIEYVESGPNVAKGNINIKCPYCAQEDPSYHMGINLHTLYYGCWRNDSHRGRDVGKLLLRLTGYSRSHIDGLLGKKSVNLSNFDKVIDSLKASEMVHKKPTVDLVMPKEFRSLDQTQASKRIVAMLNYRGFQNILDLVFFYDLRYSVTGDFKDRVIFPVYENQKLVQWTARTIFKSRCPDTSLRYLSLATKKAGRNIKHCVYNIDKLTEGKDLVFVCEGPFDALKMDLFSPKNVVALALFSNYIHEEQTKILLNHLTKQKVVILLDPGEIQNSLKLQKRLGYDNSYIEFLSGSKDPGDFNKTDVQTLVGKWI